MSVKLSAKPRLRQTGEVISAAYKKLRAEESGKFAIVVSGMLFLAAVAYLSLAYNWPKFSRAEVFFAECVREMFQADNLVTPLYHGTPFFDKPILAYWFIAASYKLAGISHFAARIPSVLTALLTVLLTAVAGRNFFGPRAGTLAAAVLGSSLMFISFSNLCMSDMNLVFFDSLSLTLLYAALQNEKRRSILFYTGALSMGLAFLTKGPVGIVLPAVAYAAYLSISKEWHKLKFGAHILPCALILLGAGVPWFMAAYRQNGAGALSYFFIHENLERFAGSTYDTHRPIWFMLVSLFSGMLPWSIFLPFAAKDSLKAFKAGFADEDARKHLYLWLWTAVVIGFFSVSRGKIDYYALPVYPAVAILISNYLSRSCDSSGKFVAFAAYLSSTLLLFAGLASFFVLPGVFVGQSPESWLALPLSLCLPALAMFYFCIQKQLRKCYKMLFISICMIATAFAWQFYPWISSKQAVLKYIPYIRNLGPESRIGVYTSLQNWIDEITFQTNTEPMKIESPAMAEQFLKAKSPTLLLIQESEYAQMSPAARSRSRVLASNPFIPRSLNPVYLLSKGEKLGEKTKLLLLSNQ
ncbi:MAG: glycosyltransferase family 39 protein [Candidatus Obscuribacterales bacterium]|nr:glycosyltransferase family 39 protein [Candidatus Obscuribacterales bacterium]